MFRIARGEPLRAPAMTAAAIGVSTALMVSAIGQTVRPDFPSTNQVVRALAIDSVRGIAYIGGDFTRVGEVDRLRLAAIDLATGEVLPWTPTANATVEAIAVDGDRIYIGGRFGSVNGNLRSRIAALNLNGTLDLTWIAHARSEGYPPDFDPALDDVRVTDIAVTATNVFVAGNFSEVRSITTGQPAVGRSRLAAFTKDNASVRNWNPGPNGTVAKIVTSGSTLHVLGGFTTIRDGSGNVQARRGYAQFNGSVAIQPPNPQATSSFGSTVEGFSSFAQRGTGFFLGGEFSRIGALNRSGVAEFNASGTLQAFAPNPSSIPLSMFADADVLYAGELEPFVNGVRYYLRAYDLSGDLIRSWRPDLPPNSSFEDPFLGVGSPRIAHVEREGDWIYLAGSFTSISGVAKAGIAAISPYTAATSQPPPPAPTLALRGSRKIKTTNSRLVLRGVAANADRVEFQHGKSRFQAARGSAERWKIPVRLTDGRSIVKIRAIGPGGQSRILKVSVNRVPK